MTTATTRAPGERNPADEDVEIGRQHVHLREEARSANANRTLSGTAAATARSEITNASPATMRRTCRGVLPIARNRASSRWRCWTENANVLGDDEDRDERREHAEGRQARDDVLAAERPLQRLGLAALRTGEHAAGRARRGGDPNAAPRRTVGAGVEDEPDQVGPLPVAAEARGRRRRRRTPPARSDGRARDGAARPTTVKVCGAPRGVAVDPPVAEWRVGQAIQPNVEPASSSGAAGPARARAESARR